MFRQIVHLWMFGPVDMGEALEALVSTGADGIDLSVSCQENHHNLAALSGDRAGKQLMGCGLPVEVVTPLYRAPQLDFSHPDKNIRRATVEFTNNCVDLAGLYGAKRVLVSPSHIGTGCRFHNSYEEDWKRAADALSESAGHAEKQGVMLMLEPICRYMVSLVHTIAEGRRMMEEVASPALCLLPDTFHMNIEEEKGAVGGIRAAKGHMGCLHVSDNNRKPPFFGAMDWKAILRALKETGFDGPLSHEPMELYYSEVNIAADGRHKAVFIEKLARSIQYLRQCMRGDA
jgi:sugar phosphate isomerase/epimerase